MISFVNLSFVTGAVVMTVIVEEKGITHFPPLQYIY
jgi:hypothetical protein